MSSLAPTPDLRPPADFSDPERAAFYGRLENAADAIIERILRDRPDVGDGTTFTGTVQGHIPVSVIVEDGRITEVHAWDAEFEYDSLMTGPPGTEGSGTIAPVPEQIRRHLDGQDWPAWEFGN